MLSASAFSSARASPTRAEHAEHRVPLVGALHERAKQPRREMTGSRQPTVAIDTVNIEKARDLFESADAHPFAQTRLEHSDIAARTNSQFASEILLSQPALHAS